MNPIFYFFIALTAVLAATTNAAGPVLDIDGDSIFDGTYYVLPVIRGRGGGLTLAGRGDKPCPLDIIQESSEVDEGLPVKFSNWRSRVGFVPESENLNIKTDVGTFCVLSTYWWLDAFDRERLRWIVTTGPKPEEDGEDSSRSFFQIQKSGDDAYKFVFCPLDCAVCTCFNVGIFVDEKGVGRLALSFTPFLVKFKKFNETDGSSLKAISM